ncbi:MAG: hypothetical protein WBE46_03040 [Dehalococcoidia bacterium]
MFGKGKINIAIQKTYYAPGDIISGDVALTLKKPVKAREVSISLIGEQLITSRQKESGWGIAGGGIGYSSSSSAQAKRERIYDFKLPLDSEREYSEGREYRFEIKIPADIPQMPKPEAKPGEARKVAQTVAAVMGLSRSSPIEWYLLAKLDIPRGLDIMKKVGITIE